MPIFEMLSHLRIITDMTKENTVWQIKPILEMLKHLKVLYRKVKVISYFCCFTLYWLKSKIVRWKLNPVNMPSITFQLDVFIRKTFAKLLLKYEEIARQLRTRKDFYISLDWEIRTLTAFKSLANYWYFNNYSKTKQIWNPNFG